MRYALIDDGVVTNIIWLYPGNASEYKNAVPCGDIPVAIGDTYADGVFYRDGERVMSKLAAAQEELADMKAALNMLGVSVDE